MVGSSASSLAAPVVDPAAVESASAVSPFAFRCSSTFLASVMIACHVASSAIRRANSGSMGP
ncbi:hypothetical protein [Rhodococcus sp. NPDC058514]|uniref:hypothetical protein n=1 Tax=Rhodococcus sp. NPDC058514 TaxID=3346532 RepID=UPI00364DDB17